DSDHTSHRSALAWFRENASAGWASCPITQNGCVRIMSHPGYPNAHAVAEVVERLRAATAHSAHEFWPDDQSVLDEALVDASRVHGPRQLTDVYLLALAVRRRGRLVTFDSAIAIGAVEGARREHLVSP
ncbi:MAG: VapC toxin family PIN domain ribonuclease, partial [Gemmatimonadota bacterium]|nr:VapC toxin family PIN domain ribonuclease [Gemmatimonadota bacterium]